MRMRKRKPKKRGSAKAKSRNFRSQRRAKAPAREGSTGEHETQLRRLKKHIPSSDAMGQSAEFCEALWPRAQSLVVRYRPVCGIINYSAEVCKFSLKSCCIF